MPDNAVVVHPLGMKIARLKVKSHNRCILDHGDALQGGPNVESRSVAFDIAPGSLGAAD